MSRLFFAHALLLTATLLFITPAGGAAEPALLELLAVLRDNGTITPDAYELLRNSALADAEQTDVREREIATRTEAMVGSVAIPEWSKRVKVGGDLRYRHELIDEEGLDDRNRHRIRARLDVAARVTDTVAAGLRLSTGGDDPVSGNQTLDGGLSRKEFGVDQAYFAWQPRAGMQVIGGKFTNPFFRAGSHPLIFDGDLNPEGLAFSFSQGPIFGNLAGFWIEERAASADSLMLGGQFGARGKIDGVTLTGGLSYYDFLHTRGQTPFYSGAAEGNSLNAAGRYINDYDELEVFAEAGFDAAGRPAKLFASYVTNTAADRFDTGYVFGAKYGKAGGAGTWELGYSYQRLEADAVVGTFTDSDYAGGGTDGKGHVLKAGYALADGWVLNLTYFLNERGFNAGNKRDYDRLQADVTFAF